MDKSEKRKQDKHEWIRRYRAPRKIDQLLQRLMEAWQEYKQLNAEKTKGTGKHKRKP